MSLRPTVMTLERPSFAEQRVVRLLRLFADRQFTGAPAYGRDLDVHYTDRQRTSNGLAGQQEGDLGLGGWGRDEFSSQLDLRYHEHGTDPMGPLALDARFPSHGGQRLSGSPVQHEPTPPQQEQQHITFRGMDPPATPGFQVR